MFAKSISMALVSASLIVVPIERAQASDAGKILGGLLIGGIIVNEMNKNKRRRTTSPGMSNSQRAQNRQVQTALNYFGYNVGRVDGSIGRNTRNGIARYQSDMGFPADGTMDSYERDFLINSQQRAEVSYNIAPYNTIVATQGRGGLLRTFRNEQLGIAPAAQAPAVQQFPAVQQQVPAVQPQLPPVQQQAALPAPVPTPIPAAPQIQPTRATTQALPEFTFNQSVKSVSTLCYQIGVLTAANGGVTSAARVTDPAFALSEQFCLARTHARTEAATIEATIPNMTPAQVEAQCKGLAQAVAPHITALGTSSPDSVISATSAFMASSGQPVASLVSGGKVCLGVGYRTDNAEMALASAVLLTSAGLRGYGEIVSHQMREGVGTARTAPQQSDLWMSLALNGMVGANPPVLGQSPERVAVLTTAMGTDGAAAAALPVFPSSN
ncbi:MAG: peptidoglycan-binding protein [Rhodobacteraceae bacterium]|nr:peptidoglycan-binding protein [Paracoccaceae bacterium]